MAKRFSMLNRITLLMIPVMVMVLFVLLFLPSYMRYQMREEVVDFDRDGILQQVGILDDRLSQDENFLINLFQFNADINALRRGNEPSDTANHVFAIRQLFLNQQIQGNASEIYFVLLEDKNQSAYVTSGSFSAEEKKALTEYLSSFPLSEELESISWRLVTLGEATYCVRSICRNNVCIGGIIRVTTLMEQLRFSEGKIALLDPENHPVPTVEWLQEEGIILDGLTDTGYLLTGSPDKYLALQVPFQSFSGSLAYFILDAEVLGSLNQAVFLSRVLGILAGVILVLTLLYFHLTLRQSLTRLKSTIIALQQFQPSRQ